MLSLRMKEVRMKLACSLAEPENASANEHANFILTSDILRLDSPNRAVNQGVPFDVSVVNFLLSLIYVV